MFVASLSLMLAGFAAGPVAPPAIEPAGYTGRFGCHPYSARKASCTARSGETAERAIADAAAQRCHPDPTKSLLCDAQARRSPVADQFVLTEKAGVSAEH